ncbi:unnamed protein product [Nesidiocoris tenuis]|uniref:Uncharacterized protein n=1 Tax=Nesidiocoris tenuis TaxID=355587 RepID=A0A6H5HQ01_9HEMI|nr:unnamed protein product [Nesidiocoris tenuis]
MSNCVLDPSTVPTTFLRSRRSLLSKRSQLHRRNTCWKPYLQKSSCEHGRFKTPAIACILRCIEFHPYPGKGRKVVSNFEFSALLLHVINHENSYNKNDEVFAWKRAITMETEWIFHRAMGNVRVPHAAPFRCACPVKIDDGSIRNLAR